MIEAQSFKREPSNQSFPPMVMSLYSIKRLLTQCTEISGIRYLIDKNVAGGEVIFGSSTNLNGNELVKAIERTLQTERAEWVEFRGGVHRKESLVLIPIGTDHVMDV